MRHPPDGPSVAQTKEDSRMSRRFWSLLLLAACLACPVAARTDKKRGKQPDPIVILISIDGFRASYLRKDHSPTLDALANGGASGSLRPSFPANTFPNHYAMVTGQRPDTSGIVNNAMEDPGRPGVAFALADQAQLDDPFWWDGAEPIWVTAEKAGIRSATMFWPGSTTRIRGGQASDWVPYDQTLPSAQRVAKVVEWLRRPAATRPRFVTLYFDEVDVAGHKFGPDAPETAAAIGNVDRALATLQAELKTLALPANLLVVSDHGMAAIDKSRTIDLDTLLPRADYRIVYAGPTTAIAPMPGKEAAVTAALSGRRGKMSCWPKAKVPEDFHYGKHPRVAPILCLADFGWQISQGPQTRDDKGGHGFHPEAPDMTALFIGHGPAFPGPPRALGKVDNIQLYGLLAHLLGITPLPNDADAEIEAKTDKPTREWLRKISLTGQLFPK
jgi:predicted AlkP superfamily pyrophosphatase or phosphodiesterase